MALSIEYRNIKKIRQRLHSIPEPSGKENKTAQTVIQYLKQCNADQIIENVGGNGILAVFNSNTAGPVIVFRAELDALPIHEKNSLSYKSMHEGYSHSCGHDGHMAILLGLGFWLQKEIKKLKGKILLLFQPSEENASGAHKVINDLKFFSLKPDYIFAIHNIPGFPLGSILLKKDVFCSGSVGLIITLLGKTSHAAYPSQGINPVKAMNVIIEHLLKLPTKIGTNNQNSLVTIIHVKLGEISFGTSPGKATIMATFRSHDTDEMQEMKKLADQLIKKTAKNNVLQYTIEWVDYFPVLYNDSDCVNIINQASKKLEYSIQFLDKPLRWSEDFSYFLQTIKGAMIGMGSGIHQPQLHNPDYDFPDELLQPSIHLFQTIIHELIDKQKKVV